MPRPAALQKGCYYHIHNRGNNRQDVFIEERNYAYFMELYSRYIAPVAKTYTYCLLKNHFHFLVYLKTEEQLKIFRVSETRKVSSPDQQFGHLFNAYTKAINKAYIRTGSLFQKPFRRIQVTAQAHLIHLVAYIHLNPQKHGLIDDYRL